MACNMISRAAIATSNRSKIIAAKRVLERLCGIGRIEEIRAPKNLPSQPVGGLEVFRGALVRALTAYKNTSGEGFGIGLEAGLLEFYSGNGYLEGEVAVIVGPGDRVSVGTSSLFPLPTSIIDRMKRGEELSSLVGRRVYAGDIGESIGYIGVASRGFITRVDLHVEAIAMALLPWVEGFYYDLPHVREYSRIVGDV